METEKTGIAVAGSLIADTFYKIDTYPKQGLLTNIRDTVSHVGGTGNLILDLAKLDADLPVKVSAVIGEGSNGRMIKRKLGEFQNIDLRNVTQKGRSSTTLVMDALDTRQRTFFFQAAASDIYEEKYIDWEIIDAKIFHLEYLLLMKKVDAWDSEFGTHGARILHDARARGMKTSIDAVSEQGSRASAVVSAALKYTDYCSINEVEAEAATGLCLTALEGIDEVKVKEALRRLAGMGVSEWAVIHSPTCGYGYDCREKQFVKVPSLSLPEGYIKGSNGAGDAYCSGILYGAYKGKTLQEAMELGTACAACSLSETNGTDGMRTYREVMEVYQKMR